MWAATDSVGSMTGKVAAACLDAVHLEVSMLALVANQNRWYRITHSICPPSALGAGVALESAHDRSDLPLLFGMGVVSSARELLHRWDEAMFGSYDTGLEAGRSGDARGSGGTGSRAARDGKVRL